jgi:hypothetical protein
MKRAVVSVFLACVVNWSVGQEASSQPSAGPDGASGANISGTAISLQDYAGKQGSSINMLPMDAIYLRNNSNAKVELYARNTSGSGRWELTYLDGQQEVTVNSHTLWLAVATKTNAPIRPISQLNLDTLQSDSIRWDAYFVLLLHERRRYELCWSEKTATWVIGEIRTALC